MKRFPILDINNRYLKALIILIAFALFYKKLSLYFLSDDFWFIWQYRNIQDVFNSSSTYHLNPVPQFLIFYIGNILGGFNAIYYHVITLLLHTINILLVFKLTEVLFNNKWTSMTASLLFISYFMNYEVIYWITGIYYILLTFFGLSSLLLLISYLNRKSIYIYLLFVTTFALTVFTLEQGFLLIGIYVLYETLISSSRSKIYMFSTYNIRQKVLFVFKTAIKYVPLFIIISLFFILKAFMAQDFIAQKLTINSSIMVFLSIMMYLFIPYPLAINNRMIIDIYLSLSEGYLLYIILLTIFILLSILGIIFYRLICKYLDRIISNNGYAYFLLFCSILVYIIPHSLATGLQARYFYFPSIFSSIILGNLFVTNISNFVIPRNIISINIKNIFHIIFILFISVSVPVNIKFLTSQYYNWEEASIITKNIIRDTRFYISDRMEVKNVYYVNLPDGIYKTNRFGWPDAYIFRNGSEPAVRLSIPDREFGAIMTYRTEENPSGIEKAYGVRTSVEHQFVTMEQIDLLAEIKSNIILIYNKERQTVEEYYSGNMVS